MHSFFKSDYETKKATALLLEFQRGCEKWYMACSSACPMDEVKAREVTGLGIEVQLRGIGLVNPLPLELSLPMQLR